MNILKITLLMAMVGIISLVNAQAFYTDIYTASENARKSGKPIIYIVRSTKCQFCAKYWRDTISKPEIINELNNNFVFAVSTLDQGDKVPSNLPFNGQLPTTYVLSNDTKLITNPIEGHIDSFMMYKLLKTITEARQ